jgi:TonB-dependent Receptor Plug Domain
MRIFCFFLMWVLIASKTLSAQTGLAFVKGTVKDDLGDGLAGVTVILLIDGKEKSAIVSEEDGSYKISVPAKRPFKLLFSMLSYQKKITNRSIELEENTLYEYDVSLSESTETIAVEVEAKQERDAQRIKREDIEKLATTTMNLESMLQFLASGVSAGTGGELTSQYSVRGGNYDENLIYVNGFEIYRPLLIRASQQEGLTFPNPDMLESLLFSNGGFKAQYGDKMSSVLDVQYRRPTRKFEGSAGGSMLGAQAYAGGAIPLDLHRKFTYTLGARYKTTRYLLGSQAIKGEYVPNFVDVQTNLIYDISRRVQLEVLGNYSLSSFFVQPKDGSNDASLFNYALNLSSKFQGSEQDDFKNGMAGAALSWTSALRQDTLANGAKFDQSTRHKLLTSYYQSQENERIDRFAEYYLTQKETDPNSENFGEAIATLGYGISHLFARNYLQAKVANVEYRGVYSRNVFRDSLQRETHHLTQWGVGYKNERISDNLKEWTRDDSLYYTVPLDTNRLTINNSIRTAIELQTHRLQGFLQHSWKHISKKTEIELIGGLRANYSSLNGELVVSPRMQMFYTPRKFSSPLSDSTTKTKDLTFKLCAGAYNQPPFYREMRDLQGIVNTQMKAQRSWQLLTGVVWDFVAWKRRFKFISEAYYKRQFNMVGYEIDNVRVRYYGQNNVDGYVLGWDFRLNGELVKGLESWVNLSILSAKERFAGVEHKERVLNGNKLDTLYPTFVPKPTDQAFIFSMYFQDKLPKAEWAQVNVAFTVGAGLPFGAPRNLEYRNTYRYRPYHRIDIGFNFQLWNQQKYIRKNFENDKDAFRQDEKSLVKKGLRAAWFSIEAFNLMQAANQSSMNWIRAYDGTYYGIGNTLTSFRINARFRVEF